MTWTGAAESDASIKGTMQHTITKVDEREGGFFISWRGERKLTLWIAKPAVPPKRGDVIVFKDAPSAGRLMPEYRIVGKGGKRVG